MSEVILETRHLVKEYGALRVTDDLSFQLLANEVHAVIGPNGAGKTTLMAQLSGQLAPTSGSIGYRGNDITRLGMVERVRQGIVRSFQITSLWPELSVLENVILSAQMTQGHAFRFLQPVSKNRPLADKAMAVLQALELDRRAHTPVYALSHGEQRQLEIAVVLAREPSVLLLDEPLAGMGVEDSAHLVGLLHQLKGRYTILIVEHDMDVVFSLADRISVLVYGRCIATGTPEAIRANEEVRTAYLGEDELC